MAEKRPPMSKREMDVARVVWRLREATLGQVFEEFSKEKTIDYTTVHSYLKRLVAKGYLTTRMIGRYKLYSAKIRPKKVMRETVDDLMNRLFDGDALALMDFLIHDRGMKAEDVRKLRAMLSKLEDEQDES